MTHRKILPWLLVFHAMSCCACRTGLTIPADWENSPETQPATAATDVTNTGGRLQVIICYGHVFSNHACLRIDGPGDHALFWDPGGGYGEADPTLRRRDDILVDEQALSLVEVWRYRRDGCNEPAMLVFEWQLTAENAQAKRDILIHGQTRDDPQGSFNADAPGGFCCVYLSGFLKRFMQDKTPLPRTWFWPHNLAGRLWQCRPDRVWLFTRKAPVRLYQMRSSPRLSS